MQTLINAKALWTIAALLASILSVAQWQKHRAVEIDNRPAVSHATALNKYAAERQRIQKEMRIGDAVENYRAK